MMNNLTETIAEYLVAQKETRRLQLSPLESAAVYEAAKAKEELLLARLDRAVKELEARRLNERLVFEAIVEEAE